MKNIYLICIFVLVAKQSFSLESFELRVGGAFYHTHHVNCELPDPSIHRGYGLAAQILTNWSWERISLYTGLVASNVWSEENNFPLYPSIPLGFQYAFLQFKKVSLFVDVGARVVGGPSLVYFNPIFLGSKYTFGRLSIIVKARGPSVDSVTDKIGTFPFLELGVDALLAIKIGKYKRARKILDLKSKSIPCLRM